MGVAATLEELEARVAALEAGQADYRAVLAAINALGANQRDLFGRMGTVEDRLIAVEDRLTAVERSGADTNARVRSLEENVAEVKDLVIRVLDR